MKAAYRTDAGKQRIKNQDAVLVDPDLGLFLLADGVGGGHKAGEVASDLAVKEVYAYLKNRITPTLEKDAISDLLRRSVNLAHHAIMEKSRSAEKFEGMGTTLSIMFIKDRTAFICHVGDSRAYIIRSRIRQVTEDHTFQNYLDHHVMIRNLFFRKKARTLMQAVGITRDLSPETVHVGIKQGAVVLLCSDGLTDMLDDGELLGIIRNNNFDLDASADALVSEANAKGGKDNISVVLVSPGDNTGDHKELLPGVM